MFGNNPFNKKKDPVLESVQAAMQDGATRRQAEALVNEQFGVYSRKAVVREQLAAYDAALEETYQSLKEGVLDNIKSAVSNANPFNKVAQAMGGSSSAEAKPDMRIMTPAKPAAPKDGASNSAFPANEETINEVSLKAKISVYKNRAKDNQYSGAMFDDDDKAAAHSEKMERKDLENIRKHHGEKGVEAAERAANHKKKYHTGGYGSDPTSHGPKWKLKTMQRGERKGKLDRKDQEGVKRVHQMKLDKIRSIPKPHLPEETQIDEISNKTKGAYLGSAVADLTARSQHYGGINVGAKAGKFGRDLARKIKNRQIGIANATKDIREEEQIDEVTKYVVSGWDGGRGQGATTYYRPAKKGDKGPFYSRETVDIDRGGHPQYRYTKIKGRAVAKPKAQKLSDIVGKKSRMSNVEMEESKQIDELYGKGQIHKLRKGIRDEGDTLYHDYDQQRYHNKRKRTPADHGKHGAYLKKARKVWDKSRRADALADAIAAKNLAKKKQDAAFAKNPRLKEETQLDEISKGKLGAYIKQASHDVATRSALTGRHAVKSQMASKDQDFHKAKIHNDLSDKHFSKSWNRRKYMAKAVDRLTKEDTSFKDALLEKLNEKASKSIRPVAGVKTTGGVSLAPANGAAPAAAPAAPPVAKPANAGASPAGAVTPATTAAAIAPAPNTKSDSAAPATPAAAPAAAPKVADKPVSTDKNGYVSYAKGSDSANDFKKTFDAHRAAGDKEFKWKGGDGVERSYNTLKAGEKSTTSSDAAKSSPASSPTTPGSMNISKQPAPPESATRGMSAAAERSGISQTPSGFDKQFAGGSGSSSQTNQTVTTPSGAKAAGTDVASSPEGSAADRYGPRKYGAQSSIPESRLNESVQVGANKYRIV